MSNRTHIEVKGLKELQASLRKMDKALPKQMRLALNEASQLVINKARIGIPRRTGRAAASLKLRSSQREARIAAGGTKAPYYPWLDFGGSTGKNKTAHRKFYTEGRYIYPALRENKVQIIEVLQGAIVELATEAGLEVT